MRSAVDLFQTQVAHCVTFPTWGCVCVDVQHMRTRGVRKKKHTIFCANSTAAPLVRARNRSRNSKTRHETRKPNAKLLVHALHDDDGPADAAFTPQVHLIHLSSSLTTKHPHTQQPTKLHWRLYLLWHSLATINRRRFVVCCRVFSTCLLALSPLFSICSPPLDLPLPSNDR